MERCRMLCETKNVVGRLRMFWGDEGWCGGDEIYFGEVVG